MQTTPSLSRRPHNSGKFLALGFAAVIVLGTVLLALPASGAGHVSIGLSNALFTATSSVCVTGLSVINVSVELSRFGQIVLLFLIQVGGLGFLTFSTLLFMLAGKRISLRNRLVIRESMNTDQLNGLTGLTRWVVTLTLCVELAGAALLSIRMIPSYGLENGMFFSIFHAISAFCNAGFDLIGSDSLIPFQQDPLVLLTLSLLILCGGLGFAVFSDLWRHRRLSRLSVHTRLVLLMTAILLGGGTLAILTLEWSNPDTLGALSPLNRFLNAFFQSVTLRTAGFASFSQAAMRPASKLISMLLMFIGAAPASTGGGVKLTTFAALLLLISDISRGREQTAIFRRTLPRKIMERAMCIFLISWCVVLADALLLSITEVGPVFEDILYESVSAFATVGLSCGLTGTLSPAGRAIIIMTMFIGRVGPLTLALAIAGRQSGAKDKLKYPETDIIIG